MTVKPIYCNPFREACYVVSEDRNAVIIDCGAYSSSDEDQIARYVKSAGLTIIAHLLTHAHLDHVFGARWVYEYLGVMPHMKEADNELYSRVREQAEMFGLPLNAEPMEGYIPLPDKQLLLAGFPAIDIIPCPGHTPGGVSYRIRDTLFTGDTLFQSGIGRTDLPGGDYAQLMNSLARLMTLPENLKVYPGHGYPTTIAEEKQFNPYF